MTKEEAKIYHRQYYLKNKSKMNAQHRKWSENNRDKIQGYKEKGKQKHADYLLRRKFNISLEEYNDILKKQNGTCALCTAKHGASDSRRLAVDHCHKTGKVRGLLCGNHNTALGLFEDDESLLLKAIDYLRKSV